MKYRRFGKTEIEMPVISCGGMRFQQSWEDFQSTGLDQKNQDNLEATVRHAFELGINHFETARGYGTSEYQLGLILPKLPRDKIIIQTKIGVKESEEEFIEAFEVSLKNLQVDYIDLLTIHGINNMSLFNKTLHKGSLSACKKLKERGLIKHIGFSTHAGPEVICKVLQTDEFSFVNLHWYYIDQRNWPAIQEAAKRDIGIFIISPCDKGGQLYKPPQKLIDICKPLTPMEFNDLFCLQHDSIHTLSIGAAKPSDLDQHAEIIESLGTAVHETLLRPILERMHTELVNTLGAYWIEHWSNNLPAPEEQEDKICLYHILRIYNFAKTFDMVEFGKFRYNLLGNANHWFPGQKVTKEASEMLPQQLAGNPLANKIKNILKEAHEMFDDIPLERLSTAQKKSESEKKVKKLPAKTEKLPTEVKKLQKEIISLKKQLIEAKEQLKFEKQATKTAIKTNTKSENKHLRTIKKLNEKLTLIQNDLAASKSCDISKQQQQKKETEKLLQKIDFLEISADSSNELIEKSLDEILKLKKELVAAKRHSKENSGTKNSSQSSLWQKRFFLRVQNGRIFGPVSITTLYDWAARCRVSPKNSISEDKETWTIVTSVPELGIEWLVTLPDDTVLGPVNIMAVQHIIQDEEAAPDAIIYNTKSKLSTTANQVLTPQFINLQNQNQKLQKELENMV
jgi:predicted aldo/keto reductase-like oxidoreductase